MPYGETKLKDFDKAEELSGKLEFQSLDDKLMHSVLENDSEIIEQGKMLSDAAANNLSAFTPDIMMEQMVKNFKLAKQIYGQKLIRAISGYDEDYLEKNMHIPEFQRELKQKISENIDKLKENKLIDKQNTITERGFELACLVSYVEELDKFSPQGSLGEKIDKKSSIYGEPQEVRTYKMGDRYRDISVRKTLKTAIRRGHDRIGEEDFRINMRQAKGQLHIVYALDASASMKGGKIDKCKKAGIALAYKAIEAKDMVGLIVFGKDIQLAIPPTQDFSNLIRSMMRVKAHHETNIALTLKKAIELFPPEAETKHLVLITDALPTAGKKPEPETLDAASLAKAAGITISLIGINLDESGKKLAEKIVEIGEGRLFSVKETDELDVIILEDYYAS